MITDDQARGTPTFLDYLLVVRRRKWHFLVAAVLVPAVAVLLSIARGPSYEASAEVLLNQPNLASSLTGAQAPYVDPGRAAQTEAQLARVPEVARRVTEAVPVQGLTSFKFLKSSSVSATAGSDLLTFSVKNSDPEIAKRLATAYARAFTRYRDGLDSQEFKRAYGAVQAQLARLEKAGLKGSAVYRSLVQKERQLTAVQALHAPTAVVVQEADRAPKMEPKIPRNGMIGLALGLVLGLGLAFLAEALDTRVRSVDVIRERLGLRLLGSLPAPPRTLEDDDRLVMMAAPMSHQAEPYRALRATLDFANADLRARTIMVTSAVDGEGTTTTVANLAVALARAGRRVVLVDFNLRKPRLHRLFDLGERSGVINVELGDIQFDDASQHMPAMEQAPDENGNQPTGPEGKLEILSAADTLQDRDQLGGELAVARIAESLQGHADLVLIDAAPLLPVSDSIALSAHVDALILVVRSNALRSSALDDVNRILSSSPAAKLGFVLTWVEWSESYQQHRYFAPRERRNYPEDRVSGERYPSRWQPQDDALSEAD